MPFYGAAILCTDDAGVREIVPMISRPVIELRLRRGRAGARRQRRARVGGTMHFTVQRRNGVTLPDLDVMLNLPGEHNVLNALAAIAVAAELERARCAGRQGRWPSSTASAAASSATASSRRATGGGTFTLIDDYGHHPVEMAATLAAARGAFPGRRLVLAFQPHRYTRTRDCFEDFVKVHRQRRRGAAGRGLCRRRGADRRRRRPLAGARAARRRQGRAGVRRRHRRDAAGDPRPRARRRRGDLHGRRLDRRVPAQVRRAAATESRHEHDRRRQALGKVAVLMGGTSAEREVSLMSGTGVLAALRVAGRRRACLRSGRARSGRAEARGLRALLHRAARPPRRRRHACRARSSCSAFPYTGSGVMASSDRDGQGHDQARLARRGPADAALRVPGAATSRRASSVRAVPDELGLPLIVKPPREGSSIGVTKVAGYSQMQDAVRAGGALRRRRAVRGVHRRRRGHLPGARRGRERARAAGDPHRRARGRLRLPEQVLHRRRPVPVPERPAGRPKKREIQRLVAGRLPHARLPRLGPRRPDDPRRATASPSCSR